MRQLETNILNKAADKLKELTALDFDIKTEVKLPNNRIMDARIRIPKLKVNLYVEVKANVTNQTLGAIVHQINAVAEGEQKIIVTQYVPPQMADKMREFDIQFIDTAGNAYINLPNIFLFIKGNKVTEERIKEKPVRAFQPAGLQLIYALLCNPGLERENYRMMVNAADIAIGTINLVMKDLSKLGYIIDLGNKGRKLVKKKDLLQRWVNLYAELLRPKLLLGRYVNEELDWQNTDIKKLNALWGGETAAAITTNYLKPQIHTIYTNQDLGPILLKLKLKKEVKGNVAVYRKFWGFKDIDEKRNVVHPILVYADLLATGENRNIETAKIIYEREVVRYLGED